MISHKLILTFLTLMIISFSALSSVDTIDLSILKIECKDKSGLSDSEWGTGFFISPNGNFIMARHTLPKGQDIDDNECSGYIHKFNTSNSALEVDYDITFKVKFYDLSINQPKSKHLIGRLIGVNPLGSENPHLSLFQLNDLSKYRCGSDEKKEKLLPRGYNSRHKETYSPVTYPPICLHHLNISDSESWEVSGAPISGGSSGGPVLLKGKKTWPRVVIGVIDGGWDNGAGGVLFFHKKIPPIAYVATEINQPVLADPGSILNGGQVYQKVISVKNNCKLLGKPVFTAGPDRRLKRSPIIKSSELTLFFSKEIKQGNLLGQLSFLVSCPQ